MSHVIWVYNYSFLTGAQHDYMVEETESESTSIYKHFTFYVIES